MKKLILLSVITIGALAASCSQTSPKQPERLPEEEIPAYRDACVKLAPYIALEDSAYHITITKKEAVSKGVPEKYYDRMRQDIEYTNYLIQEEYNKKGIPIEVPEYQIDTLNNR